MKSFKDIKACIAKEEGASFVEMALLIALIGVVSIAGAQTFGESLNGKLTQNTEEFNKAFAETGTTVPCSGGRGNQCGG